MWTDEVVPIVRYLINDYDSPLNYTDDRIIDICIIAAHLINNEITFNTTYTVTISSNTVSPDPSTDVNFINLVALKATCIIFNSESKTAGDQAVTVRDGPSSISLGGKGEVAIINAKTACDAFEYAKLNYLSGGSVGAHAIISPRTIELY